MTVTSIRDAWAEVSKIFPTDYEHDTDRSERAGYPIYYSTAASVNAWISDLGNRLEVNLPDGKSVNIWIKVPQVEKPARTGAVEVTEYRSCVWQKNGLRPEELKKMAQKIFANGKIAETHHNTYGTNDPTVTHGDEWGNVLTGNVVFVVKCEGLPIEYIIHMEAFEVSVIIERIQQ